MNVKCSKRSKCRNYLKLETSSKIFLSVLLSDDLF